MTVPRLPVPLRPAFCHAGNACSSCSAVSVSADRTLTNQLDGATEKHNDASSDNSRRAFVVTLNGRSVKATDVDSLIVCLDSEKFGSSTDELNSEAIALIVSNVLLIQFTIRWSTFRREEARKPFGVRSFGVRARVTTTTRPRLRPRSMSRGTTRTTAEREPQRPMSGTPRAPEAAVTGDPAPQGEESRAGPRGSRLPTAGRALIPLLSPTRQSELDLPVPTERGRTTAPGRTPRRQPSTSTTWW